jgi:hypothetical protein
VPFLLVACGGKLSASDVAKMQRKLNASVFAGIRCAADHTSGWDYVCTYGDPKVGRQKMGVVVHGHRFSGSGSIRVTGELPDGPYMKAPSDAAFARRVDAVCARRAAAVSALPFPLTGRGLLDAGQRVSALEEREQARLAGFKPPDDERAEVGAFLRSIDRVQRAIATFRDAFVRSNAVDLARAQGRLAATRSASNALARRLGLSCRH